MKNRKRWLSVILSVVLTIAMCVTTAMAVGADDGAKPTITVETKTETFNVDDEVVLNVSIANNPGFAAYNFTINYDKAELELISITKGGFQGYFVGNKETDIANFIADASLGEIQENGVLFTLTFKVKADCSNGAVVTLQTTTFKNMKNVQINPLIVSGGLNVTTGSGGSTTGGSTTGGSTTGGSTTGGSTTGGSTTGGSTTGGSTTGGSTTGGSTTGGSTTGGSTTGGSTTGGSTTGGGTTGGSVIIITPETSSPLFLSGANQVVAPGSAATFRIDKEFKDLQSVAVDGVTLDKSNYAAWSGRTYIKLLPSYTKTLSAGTHTLSAYFSGATAVTTFTISADGVKNPSTGANDVVGVAVAMAVISLLGASAVICKK